MLEAMSAIMRPQENKPKVQGAKDGKMEREKSICSKCWYSLCLVNASHPDAQYLAPALLPESHSYTINEL